MYGLPQYSITSESYVNNSSLNTETVLTTMYPDLSKESVLLLGKRELLGLNTMPLLVVHFFQKILCTVSLFDGLSDKYDSSPWVTPVHLRFDAKFEN